VAAWDKRAHELLRADAFRGDQRAVTASTEKPIVAHADWEGGGQGRVHQLFCVGGNLFRACARNLRPTACKIVGTPRGNKSRASLARPAQGAASARTACSRVWLIHFRHARSERGEGVARRSSMTSYKRPNWFVLARSPRVSESRVPRYSASFRKGRSQAHAARKGIESTIFFIPSLTITIRLGSLYLPPSLSSRMRRSA
jgi:hypothetical protein